MPVGGAIDEKEAGHPMYLVNELGLGPSDPFVNAGFAPDADRPGSWVRVVDLESSADAPSSASETLVLSELPSLPDIDCIAIISIGRSETKKVYLYETIRSIFRHFPAEAKVNVLVGNSNDAYVHQAELELRFGEVDAKRIHIFTTSPQATDYLSALPVCKRGG